MHSRCMPIISQNGLMILVQVMTASMKWSDKSLFEDSDKPPLSRAAKTQWVSRRWKLDVLLTWQSQKSLPIYLNKDKWALFNRKSKSQPNYQAWDHRRGELKLSQATTLIQRAERRLQISCTGRAFNRLIWQASKTDGS